MEWSDQTPPDIGEIEAMARAAMKALPEAFQAPAREVALRVEEYASDKMLADLGMDSSLELTGLYEGTPLTERSVLDQPLQPDTIWLFRRAILDEWMERGNVALGALVAHVYVHELAHHLGWSDADIAAIDRWWK